MPSSVLVNLFTSSNHRWCLFLYNKITCYINILLCVSVLSCVHSETPRWTAYPLFWILGQERELLRMEVTNMLSSCPPASHIGMSLNLLFSVSPAVTVSFNLSINSPTCLASTAAVYSRLKLSSVIATSSNIRLKSFARSVRSRRISRDT